MKTIPGPDDDTDSIDFAVFSCNNYREFTVRNSHGMPSKCLTRLANGYFNALGNAARKDQHDFIASLT